MQARVESSGARVGMRASNGNRLTVPRAAAPSAAPVAAQKATTVRTEIDYTKRPANNQELYTYLYDLPEDKVPSNLVVDEREVTVTDLRTLDRTFTLAENGFQFERLTVPDDIDWADEQQVVARYYPIVEPFLKAVTGATRVHIFDHTLRMGALQPDKSRQLELLKERKPVSRAHVDYTVNGGVKRLHALLPDEAERLSQTPFAVVQVWRPLRGPVDASPLGLLDAATVDKEDYLELSLHFPGRTGYNYALVANPKHRWYYAKGIDTDEAYVFVCYDSRSGRARFTPHTAFVDPSTPPNAPDRESVELRAFAFFEDEPKQPIAMEL